MKRWNLAWNPIWLVKAAHTEKEWVDVMKAQGVEVDLASVGSHC